LSEIRLYVVFTAVDAPDNIPFGSDEIMCGNKTLIFFNFVKHLRGQTFLSHLLNILSDIIKARISFLTGLFCNKGYRFYSCYFAVIIKNTPVKVLNIR